MDGLQFTIQLITPLVWPLTIVALVLLLRTGVVTLLTRLREGEFPGVKVKFEPGKSEDKEAAEVYQQVSRFDSDAMIGKYTLGGGDDSGDGQIALTFMLAKSAAEANRLTTSAARLTGTNPDSAILSCGRIIERALETFYASRRLVDGELASQKWEVDPLLQSKQLLEVESIVGSNHEELSRLLNFYTEIQTGETTDQKSASLFVHTATQTLTIILLFQKTMDDPQYISDAFRRAHDIRGIYRENEKSNVDPAEKVQE